MKAMNRITTKIAGVAIATVMMLGGMTVFAAQNENPGYSSTLTVYAKRSHAVIYFNYFATHKTMTVSESGRYSISLTAQRPGDYDKELFLSNEDGETIASVCGNQNELSLGQIHLTAGEEYDILVYAEGFVGFTILNDDDSADFTVTATLVESDTPDLDDVVRLVDVSEDPEVTEEPEIPSMPTIVIDPEPETFDIHVEPLTMPTIVIDEDPVVFDMYINPAEDNDDVVTTKTPSVVSLTPEQVRMLSVQNFVGHLYIDGLGRHATMAEMNYWADRLMCCSISATEVASQILTSAEFNEHNFDNEQIAAMLNDVFDTESEDTLAQLIGGASIESVVEQLAGTDGWASKCAFYGVNV